MKGLIQDRLADLDRLYPVWEKKTIWKFFEATAERFPNHDFIVSESGTCYTYQQAEEKILHIARSLLAIGVKPGDHVAMQIVNSPEQALVALAVSAIRAVKVAVNTSLGPRELSYILNQSESSYLITGCQGHIVGVETQLRKVIILPSAHCETTAPVLLWEDFLALAGDEPLPDSEGEAYADEVSDIIYTSGSTSAPKGVLLTHDMLMRSAFASCINRGFEIGRRVFVPLPMFHAYGYVEGMLAAILVGGAVLLRLGKFLPEPVLAFMKKGRANDILSVPSQMMALINYMKEAPTELPDLHAVYCSASICPAWVWPGIREYLKVSDVITGYGMSEVCGASMQTRPTDSDEILRSRVGRILNGGVAGLPEYNGCQIQYRVQDPQTSEACAAGVVGELWCRGVVLTKGYYNRPEINEKVFTEDGWFKTGDSGYFDDKGYLVLSGRMDDMYKINGENVSPKFLEDTVGNCPLVNNIEVVGIPDEKHGYVGVAFIQLHEDTPEHRAETEKYCRDYLAKFQVPKYYVYMTDADWPRTATGKVQKFRLREMAAALKNKQER